MSDKKRIFATSRIGDPAENRLREQGYDLEVFHGPEAPPKKLIIEKVKSGIDALITTLRDPIDAEVFEAGKGWLKVVAQIAVGFDNINRADANKYKVPFTNTADVLTEATAEFAFFMMGMLARKMYASERLVREQKWPSWHPFLPFLGDEVTGKTIAIIGTGRIGLAMIKKCSGFDMNMLCYDPAYHNDAYIASIQELMDLRHAKGIQKEKTWIKYVGFEDAFRGTDQAVADKLQAYVPLFARRANVLDIGCGRGELLAAFRTAGVGARGIDSNAEMAGAARARGLDARQADALGYLTALPEASLGGLIATQVIEHLEPSYLMRVLDAAARALQPGAPIVLETINPACWLAFFSSYIRDFTHVRPVHPETLQYLLRASGFSRVTIQYSAPVPDHMKMTTIDLPAEVLASTDATARAVTAVAHAVNANAVILNQLMFSHMDYAAVGYRS